MIFLKLGGSFLTEKSRPERARIDLIQQATAEIVQAFKQLPETRLLIGHGSGSFGHVAAEKSGTHLGASTSEDWRGFVNVWASANRLHRIVMDELLSADLPAISFPPSSYTIARSGEISAISVEPIQQSIKAGLIPVLHGDVAFDTQQGSTILSTETIMAALLPTLKPTRLLLAGLEEGVLHVGPEGPEVMKEVSMEDLPDLQFEQSEQSDVTGGMASKVSLALEMKRSFPEMEILIFSGVTPGNIFTSLTGGYPGTQIVL